MGSAKTLITVAPTGAETAKSDVPALPVTLAELVATAKGCEAAGAALIHVHVRDDEAKPTLDLGRLRETVAALRQETGLVVQLSTGGAVSDPFPERIRVLDAEPDSCSLTCGTVNFGNDVFANPWPFMVELYRRTQEREVVPEFELFDLGQVASMCRLIDSCGPPYGGRIHADLVMGAPGGMPGTAQALVAAVQALPGEATWSATGIGRSALAVALAALSAGGHLRVGMEDTLSYTRGQPVTGNKQLVERAAQLAVLAQRPPMSTGEARAMLAVKDRRTASMTGTGPAMTDPAMTGSTAVRLRNRAEPRGGEMTDPLTGPAPGGRRRIDRVLAADYLAGVENRPIDEVRALRREAQQEEADLSYLRRLLQGRIDIVRAELARRAQSGGRVVEDLPAILADEAPGQGSARHLSVQPSREEKHRRRIEEQLVADVTISNVTARTGGELAEALELLTRHERAVSSSRHAVQRVMDACTAEIARRYREGEADIEDLLRDPSP